MTIRSVLLGLAGAAVVCALTFFNDWVIHSTFFIGNNLPIAVYGSLILGILLINPIFALIWRLFRPLHDAAIAMNDSFGRGVAATLRFCFHPLTGKEYAVALVLTLAACCVPGSGLMRTFTDSIILPYHYVRSINDWQSHNVLDATPYEKNMLVRIESNNPDPVKRKQETEDNTKNVLDAFVSGKGTAAKSVSFTDIPWGAWLPALGFWIPLILIFWLTLLGLSLVVHKQWSDHEHLPYPIATFASSLMAKGEDLFADVFRSKLFWFSALAVMAIHFNNYLANWYPDRMVQMNTFVNLWSLYSFGKVIVASGHAWPFFQPTIFFSVVAFAYFLATDVSLGLGLAPYLYVFIAGTLVTYGVSVESGTPPLTNLFAFGAYLGAFLVLLYTGRRYYGDVLRCVFTGGKDVPSTSIWGARLFLVGMLGFIIYMVVMAGLEWQFAVLFAVGAVIMFLVMSRIAAETGLFFIQAYWAPAAVILGFMGAKAVGPAAIMVLGILTMVLLVDPREAFMPFMINNLKVMDMTGLKMGRTTILVVVSVLLGLAVAVPVTLKWQYDKGLATNDLWANKYAVQGPFNDYVVKVDQLKQRGDLDKANSLTGWAHFGAIVPDTKLLIAFGLGIGLVLLFTAGRLRFTKWPIHPVMFMVCVTYPLWHFGFSFLIGWAVKAGVMKYGGAKTYLNLKPLMIGLIAGEMTIGVIMIIIGFVYYLLTGQPPKNLNIMPT